MLARKLSSVLYMANYRSISETHVCSLQSMEEMMIQEQIDKRGQQG